MVKHTSGEPEPAYESPLEDPVYRTFDTLVHYLVKELSPEYWKQLLLLFDYYVSCELKRRRVIPDETPLPIVENARLQKRILH